MNKFRSFAAAVLALSFILVLSGCSAKANVSTYELKKTVTVSKNKSDNESLYTSTKPKKKLTPISRSDMTVLYLDEGNLSVCVYDSSSKKLWRSLPEKSGKEKSAMFSVTLFYKGKRYIVNSQDDSVSEKLASFEKGENSVSINYAFKKSFDDGAKINFTVPLIFSANDGMISVELDCKAMNKSNKGNVKIEEIKMLDWFGASSSAKENDYLFIPDNCGAIIKTNPTPKKFKKISLPVYEKGGAFIPAFGIKASSSAFVALIENGDAISTIHAEKALSSGGFNKVYASFKITQTLKKENKISIAEKSYNDTIKISYRFLSDDNADYVGMASACRELLIRNSVLGLHEQNNAETSFPLNLTLIGSAKFAKPGKGSHKSTTVLTNPDQTYDMLSYIKSKGIGTINVRYDGIFKGALEQKSNLALSGAFKNKAKTKQLLEFTQNQNINLFPSVNLFTFSKSSKMSKAISLDSKPTVKSEEKLSSTLISSVAETSFVSARKLGKHSEKLLSAMRKLDFGGVCLLDSASSLYCDNTKRHEQNRQQIKDEVTKQINAFSTSKSLMLSGGNVYALKYATVITDLPNVAENSGKYVKSVPFMQIILHGYTDYSSTAFNLEKDSEKAFLKAIEYGSVPAYDLYFVDYSTDEIQDNYSYENYMSEMQTYYERMSAALSDLRDKKITAHYEVKSGVFCTEYGSSTTVYVNYNKKDVRINGVTVEARSFIRI